MQKVFMTFFVAALMLNQHIGAESDWVNICNKCKCQWKSGKKSADCKNTSQSVIPRDLSPDIQVNINHFYNLKP